MQISKIILVDDNKHFREGLRFYLEKILPFKVIAEAENGQEFLKLNNINEADLILMDISMPVLNGIEASKQILAIKNYNIIALTSYQERSYFNELLEVGFKGCILKKEVHNQILNAIEKINENETFFPINKAF